MSEPTEGSSVNDPREELERATADALGRWSAAQHADVEAARRGVTEAEREAAVRSFEALARSKPRGQLTWWKLLVAAVLLVGLSLVTFDWNREARPDGPTLLGPARIEVVAPEGEVKGYDRFSWTTKEEGAPRFGLRVWNEGELDAVLTIDGLEGLQYAPTPAELQRMGPRITWQVVLQSSDGRSLEVATGSASLGSP